MTNKALWALLVAVAVWAAPSAQAQGPGAANPWQGGPGMPPALPGFRDQEKRRDDLGGWTSIPHVIPHVPSALPFSGGSNANPAENLPTPKLTLPEAALSASELRVPATRFSPASGEVTAIARGLSSGKGGGLLAAIGGGLAALRGLFRRKKES